MEHTHHVMDYIEISVVDVAAAKRFYSEAFGWSFNDYGDGYAAAVEAPEGSVLEAPSDYPGGRRFFFADPSGNKLGVYQPSDS